MSNPGSLSAALAFVPSWWQETTEPTALDALLLGWAKAAGWRAAGFVWPSEGVVLRKSVLNGQLTEVAVPEMPDASRRLKAGEATVLYALPGSAGRVFAGVMFAGRPM